MPSGTSFWQNDHGESMQLHKISLTDFTGLRSDTDKWLGSYEDATTLANDALGSIQVCFHHQYAGL